MMPIWVSAGSIAGALYGNLLLGPSIGSVGLGTIMGIAIGSLGGVSFGLSQIRKQEGDDKYAFEGEENLMKIMGAVAIILFVITLAMLF
ncbi:MAG: hypothetical protein AWU58_429 [Methanohalophilus sp. T328-1]|nr:MAG: hypothetical protein AWU58_429 [Methanohalophilus sp. T328-1]ODV49541.1 MAG: hypothetical protein A8273_1329 [Methanohalophilus sp. 2-GBenrich]RSD34639.1 MAG: hypothetical protein CI953_709 [Methanohalophilus sp.]RSD35560.1 MAG: hypothetical protein CI952_968 [Methanohalophilus sp.]RXG35067.1 hypothetical protein CI957_91 [Methanohalophilus sp. WG1-DM]